jgi:hypothetical protein
MGRTFLRAVCSAAISLNQPLIPPKTSLSGTNVKDPILALLEGDNIKEKIFNRAGSMVILKQFFC